MVSLARMSHAADAGGASTGRLTEGHGDSLYTNDEDEGGNYGDYGDDLRQVSYSDGEDDENDPNGGGGGGGGRTRSGSAKGGAGVVPTDGAGASAGTGADASRTAEFTAANRRGSSTFMRVSMLGAKAAQALANATGATGGGNSGGNSAGTEIDLLSAVKNRTAIIKRRKSRKPRKDLSQENLAYSANQQAINAWRITARHEFTSDGLIRAFEDAHRNPERILSNASTTSSSNAAASATNPYLDRHANYSMAAHLGDSDNFTKHGLVHPGLQGLMSAAESGRASEGGGSGKSNGDGGGSTAGGGEPRLGGRGGVYGAFMTLIGRGKRKSFRGGAAAQAAAAASGAGSEGGGEDGGGGSTMGAAAGGAGPGARFGTGNATAGGNTANAGNSRALSSAAASNFDGGSEYASDGFSDDAVHVPESSARPGYLANQQQFQPPVRIL
jgi:hypothetical protein